MDTPDEETYTVTIVLTKVSGREQVDRIATQIAWNLVMGEKLKSDITVARVEGVLKP